MAYERMSHVQYYSGLMTNHAEKKKNQSINQTKKTVCLSVTQSIEHIDNGIHFGAGELPWCRWPFSRQVVDQPQKRKI